MKFSLSVLALASAASARVIGQRYTHQARNVTVFNTTIVENVVDPKVELGNGEVQETAGSSGTRVLFPLYIYPKQGNWEPLKAAVKRYPKLGFTVILNPASGPGKHINDDYVREVSSLREFPNVQPIGYIKTGYCKRPLEDVYAEIDQYAAWSRDPRFKGYGMKGIFFDETPNRYTEENKKCVDAISAHVKQTKALSDGLVIHNPGTAPDKGLANPGPDMTVTVEESFSRYHDKDYQNYLATSPYGSDRSSYMVYSVPRADIPSFTSSIRERASWLFVTDADANGLYEGFAPGFNDFVDAMSKL